MNDLVKELADRGKGLDPEDRSRLVDLLLESLNEAPLARIDAAWDAEVESRLAAYDRGDFQSIEGDVVFAKAHLLARE